jgi:hypothetical protein
MPAKMARLQCISPDQVRVCRSLCVCATCPPVSELQMHVSLLSCMSSSVPCLDPRIWNRESEEEMEEALTMGGGSLDGFVFIFREQRRKWVEGRKGGKGGRGDEDGGGGVSPQPSPPSRFLPR